jgi:hypothetical protein
VHVRHVVPQPPELPDHPQPAACVMTD